MEKKLEFIFFGLTITTSWGAGHTISFRGLIKELHKKGHTIYFFERFSSLFASNSDLNDPDYCTIIFYDSLQQLKKDYSDKIKNADVVILGSFVQEGWDIGKWIIRNARGVKAFYDFDSQETLERFNVRRYSNISPELVPKYDLYLSFTGGFSLLQTFEMHYFSPMARPLYSSVDTELYYHEELPALWDLGFLGTFSQQRQIKLEKTILDAAREWQEGRFVLAGPSYPSYIKWPSNIQKMDYLSPQEHRDFFNSQRFTLNISRGNDTPKGFSPRGRVFEAAGCGTPIITDYWEGLETFFTPGKDILIAETAEDILFYLKNLSEEERLKTGNNGRLRMLKSHTAMHRADELESYIMELLPMSDVNEKDMLKNTL